MSSTHTEASDAVLNTLALFAAEPPIDARQLLAQIAMSWPGAPPATAGRFCRRCQDRTAEGRIRCT